MTQTQQTTTGWPRRLADGTPYLSPSQARELLTCPARYRFKYLEGLPDPPGVDALLGWSVHDAIEHGMKRVMNERAEVPPDWVGDRASVELLRRLDDAEADDTPIPGLEDADLQELADEAGGLAELGWDALVGEGGTPLQVEANLVHRGPRWARRGYLDLLLEDKAGGTHLVELKTAKRSPSGGKPSRLHTLQALIYAAALDADGTPVDRASVLYLVRTKTPKTVWAPVPLHDRALAWAERVWERVEAEVERGEFHPNPVGAGWMCSPKACAYWDRCPGAPKHEVDA